MPRGCRTSASPRPVGPRGPATGTGPGRRRWAWGSSSTGAPATPPRPRRPGHGQDQRQQRPRDLRPGAVRPVGVGRPQCDAVDALLGADQEVRALEKVGDAYYGARRVVMADAEGPADIPGVDDRLA